MISVYFHTISVKQILLDLVHFSNLYLISIKVISFCYWCRFWAILTKIVEKLEKQCLLSVLKVRNIYFFGAWFSVSSSVSFSTYPWCSCYSGSPQKTSAGQDPTWLYSFECKTYLHHVWYEGKQWRRSGEWAWWPWKENSVYPKASNT